MKALCWNGIDHQVSLEALSERHLWNPDDVIVRLGIRSMQNRDVHQCAEALSLIGSGGAEDDGSICDGNRTALSK